MTTTTTRRYPQNLLDRRLRYRLMDAHEEAVASGEYAAARRILDLLHWGYVLVGEKSLIYYKLADLGCYFRPDGDSILFTTDACF